MHTYEIYTRNGPVEVKAERSETLCVNNNPQSIRFITGDYIIAEFYCDHICGWKEAKHD